MFEKSEGSINEGFYNMGVGIVCGKVMGTDLQINGMKEKFSNRPPIGRI